ncbi:hypothetical protein JTE90_020481 [Oedothorax gibbosus]|uniref:Uncharacterized protein n=1 Tax=Oedothorax gibbosus TaxID=931172 RepID=A0AAV6UT27_9ARAC|nr:hypothetical protein JTE90_020481 [Oedothorax gibbosus]
MSSKDTSTTRNFSNGVIPSSRQTGHLLFALIRWNRHWTQKKWPQEALAANFPVDMKYWAGLKYYWFSCNSCISPYDLGLVVALQ